MSSSQKRSSQRWRAARFLPELPPPAPLHERGEPVVQQWQPPQQEERHQPDECHGHAEDGGEVERESFREIVQGPPAGGAGVVPGGDQGVGEDDGRVRDGDVPAARVAVGRVPDTDFHRMAQGSTRREPH
ncbi:hypothetical protein [Streptomyces tendae]|uniref:hypothetical protein n=1 Tax=Streptomyces tendae TaxID=1932 RepID=UPI0031E92C72